MNDFGDFGDPGKFNKDDGSVEIADLETIDMGWTCYSLSQGASSEELTKICESLYDRCLLQALEVGKQKLEWVDVAWIMNLLKNVMISY